MVNSIFSFSETVLGPEYEESRGKARVVIPAYVLLEKNRGFSSCILWLRLI